MLECPVCLEVVTPPIQQCDNGHVTCAKCIKPWDGCSLCRQPFLKSKPTCLNNLLEVLPRFCKYKDNGCEQVLLSKSKDNHEWFCGFREIVCRECSYRHKKRCLIQVREAYAHYEQNHVIGVPSYDEVLNDCVVFGVDISKDFSVHSGLLIDGRLFYVSMYNNTKDDHVKVTYEEFATDKVKATYSLMIELKGNGYL